MRNIKINVLEIVDPRSAHNNAFALRDLLFLRNFFRYSHGYPNVAIGDF